LVGAVVARNGRVVGQGFHRRAGEPHAEIVALRQAGKKARGATIYTNLEPCCHTGRTPPCVQAIIQAGVARVVAAMRDPDPRVNGGGIRMLRRRGLAVEVGLMKEEAARLNDSFTKFVLSGLPLVTLKGAISLDGRIATRKRDSKWITSAEAREHARLLRREHDVVLVGIGTALADNPLLTARSTKYGSIRAVVDTHLRLPSRSQLASTVEQGPVVVFAGPDAPRIHESKLRTKGVEVERVPLEGQRLDLRKCLEYLARYGVTRVLVEGGGELHAGFLEQNLADRVVFYIAPRLIGGREALSVVGGLGPVSMAGARSLKRVRSFRVGDEIVVEGDL
jgi:diaminohydroxyphosphoribosylaminopyrimidine deaminase/5-amino-6-(5-phosphoribosylamino)uracil reductase